MSRISSAVLVHAKTTRERSANAWSDLPYLGLIRKGIESAVGRAPLDLPIIFDLEIGHVLPHMPLVNGALATVTANAETRQIVQEFR